MKSKGSFMFGEMDAAVMSSTRFRSCVIEVPALWASKDGIS